MKLEEKVGREKCYEWKIGEIGRDLESASVNGTAVPTVFWFLSLLQRYAKQSTNIWPPKHPWNESNIINLCMNRGWRPRDMDHYKTLPMPCWRNMTGLGIQSCSLLSLETLQFGFQLRICVPDSAEGTARHGKTWHSKWQDNHTITINQKANQNDIRIIQNPFLCM